MTELTQLPPAFWVAAPLTILFAYTVFGLSGFGTTAIAVPILAHWLPLTYLVPLMAQLAKSEHIKIFPCKGYGSCEKTVLKFTETNISMSLGRPVQPGVYDITSEVKSLIIKKYRGNSVQAEKICVADFLTKTNCKDTFDNAEFEVLKEVSLWAAAMNIADNDKLNLLLQMVKLKPVDEYLYQELLRLFFGDTYK